MIEEFIDLNSLRTKLILKGSKTILLTNMTRKVELRATQAGREIRVLTQVKDQLFLEDRSFQKRAAFKKYDL